MIQCSCMSRQEWQWSCRTRLIKRGTWRTFLKWTRLPTTPRPLFYFKWPKWIQEWSPGLILSESLTLFRGYETNVFHCLPSPVLALFRLSATSRCWREGIERARWDRRGDRYSKRTRTTATLVGQKVQMSMKQFDQKIDKSDIKRHLKAIKMGLIRSSVHGSSNQMAD